MNNRLLLTKMFFFYLKTLKIVIMFTFSPRLNNSVSGHKTKQKQKASHLARNKTRTSRPMWYLTTKTDCCDIPSIVIFFTKTGLTALEPIRMPVVLQYNMFVPDFSITWKEKHKTLRSDKPRYIQPHLKANLLHIFPFMIIKHH